MEQNSSSSNDTVSSQKSLPSTHDSGWNDPPEWALSTQNVSSGSKRLLNKRVAFPLSSQNSPTEKSSPSPSNTPPALQSSAAPAITTAPHKPLVAPNSDKDLATRTLESDFDKDQALTEVLANLESVMSKQKMDTNKTEDVQRRLDSMKADWCDNKLNNMIQRSVLDISKALLRKDVKQADKIHISLMMQHASACRTWMPAIRHIIFELKKECEDFNFSQLEQSPLLSLKSKEK
ncbi:steroid receptor RNA activator 1-like [Nylanderia fulva]|uniref:steroid receptor RNA activator 1-like n=1 Tax=Nylanderia fulva TaxID=613905 RepID=UPI0010FB9358|nr:steroid receptor RNA activator 1-like [Nylanderia fulva]XP_029174809.1 steroid receptor RNA activator 1-like [Nylanderia fulva]XP_029174810.1 steroid receptor RNA activator 1-like [Nylanderia fulva]